jgi:hypothetical protein
MGDHVNELMNTELPKLVPRKEKGTVTAKATKADDAPVPIHLWNNRILEAFPHLKTRREEAEKALGVIRVGACRKWRKEVEASFWKWYYKTEYRLGNKNAIRAAGIEACLKARQATWWEWNGGSSTFFWRWPDEYQRDLWEGSPPWLIGEPPTGKEKQRPYKSKEAREKVKHKIDTVV